MSTTGTGPSARARCAAKALWNSSNSDSSSAFYVFGGRNSLTTYFSDLYSFDTGTNLSSPIQFAHLIFFLYAASGSWSQLPSYTTGVGLTSIAQVGNNQLYIYGGYNGNTLSATFFYDINSTYCLFLALFVWMPQHTTLLTAFTQRQNGQHRPVAQLTTGATTLPTLKAQNCTSLAATTTLRVSLL